MVFEFEFSIKFSIIRRITRNIDDFDIFLSSYLFGLDERTPVGSVPILMMPTVKCIIVYMYSTYSVCVW